MLNAQEIMKIGFLDTRKTTTGTKKVSKPLRKVYFNSNHKNILEHFKGSDWFTTIDAAGLLGMHRTSVSRIMRDLELAGHVKVTTENKVCNVLGARTNVKLYKVKKSALT